MVKKDIKENREKVSRNLESGETFAKQHSSNINDNWTKFIGELGYEAHNDVYCKKIKTHK